MSLEIREQYSRPKADCVTLLPLQLEWDAVERLPAAGLLHRWSLSPSSIGQSLNVSPAHLHSGSGIFSAFPLAAGPPTSMLPPNFVNPVDSSTLELLWRDGDAREVRLRQIITERLAACPPPKADDAI